MKKLLLLTLLIFFSSIGSTIPTITYPTNNTVNVSSFTVTWENNTLAGCYLVEEKIGDTGNWNALPQTSDKFIDRSGKEDGKYLYKVSSSSSDCGKDIVFNTPSAPAFIIIDTSPPSVSSKSPGGVNEDLSSNVTISFNEPMNTSSFSISSGSSNITFSSPVWSDSDQTVTIPYTATNQGETFVVTFKASDLAGNWVTDSLQFKTLVKPTTVTITSPKSTDEVIQGDSITFTASVTGVDSKPVTGATVTVNGGCSTTLSESGTGVYSGSCTVSGYGDNMNFTVSALNGGQEANSTVSLDVAKYIGLTVSVLSPTVFEAMRGDSIPIKVKVTADDVAVDNAVVSAPEVTFTHTSNGEYTGTLQTSYSSPKTYSLTITAEATVQNQHKTTTKTITFNLNPLSLNITPVFLENNEPTSVIHSGKIVSLKIKATYPSGSVATGTPQGTVTITSNGKQAEALNLSFEKQGDYYVADSLFTASDYDSSYLFAVSFTDPYGNKGTMEQSVLGPAKGLKFVPDKDELAFAPGQEAVIKGKVRDELNEKFITDAEIILNNKTYTYSADGYALVFNISPNASAGTKTLNLLIKTKSMNYPYPLTITITNDLKVIIPETVQKNKYTRVKILYPDGSEVTQGNFTIITSQGKQVPLQKDDQGWFAELDLGTTEGQQSLSLSGTDEYGNKLSQQAQVQYEISAVEKAKQNAPLILGLLTAAAVALFIGYYLYAYAKAKTQSILDKKNLIQKYKRLLFEKERANYLKSVIAYEFMTGQIKKEDQVLFQQNLVQNKQDIEMLISELESENPFLKENKTQYVNEALQKLQKMKEFIKQNLVEEFKESKALAFIKQKLNYGLSEEEVKKQVLEKYAEAGEKAIQKAKIMNLFKKQDEDADENKDQVKTQAEAAPAPLPQDSQAKQENEEDPIVLTSKLLKAMPEFRVKQDLINQGLDEKQAQELIEKAKKLM